MTKFQAINAACLDVFLKVRQTEIFPIFKASDKETSPSHETHVFKAKLDQIFAETILDRPRDDGPGHRKGSGD